MAKNTKNGINKHTPFGSGSTKESRTEAQTAKLLEEARSAHSLGWISSESLEQIEEALRPSS